MKNYLLAIIVLVSVACKKNNNDNTAVPADLSTLLMQHTWYAYGIRQIKTDSMNIETIDTLGNSTTVDTVLTSDTAYLLSGCIYASNYIFKLNGVLTIQYACDSNQSTINTIWKFTPTNNISFRQIADTSTNIISGTIIEPTNTQFTFSTTAKLVTYQSLSGTDSTGTVNTSDSITIKKFTIYNSR